MIDYRELLIKYMAHVGIQEGVYWLGSCLNRSSMFSLEEKQELWTLCDEADKYDN